MAKKKDKKIFQVKDKGLIYIPFHELTDGFDEDNSTNYFHLNRKKTYSNISEDIVDICNQVIEKDTNLLVNYLKLKLQIKIYEDMTLEQFTELLYKYLIDPAEQTVIDIVEENYKLNLDQEIEIKKIKNTSLIYRDIHCKLLLKISYMMKFTIPIVMEFAYMKLSPKENSNNFILTIYNDLYDYFQSDIENKINIDNKLIESIKSRIIITKYSDSTIWRYLEHSGKNTNNFIYEQVKKLKTDIVPKYDIDRSVVNLTLAFASKAVEQLFRTNFPISYKTIDMSSKSEDDETNKFERMEINAAKTNEDLNILNKINIDMCLKDIRKAHNIRITKEEFEFYKKHIRINKLQTNLLSLYFAKYLGSCNTIYNCSINQYVMFVLIMKKILLQKDCVYIPQILTGYVDNAIKEKKVVSKKYLTKIIEDERYKKILEYNYNASINILVKQSIIEKIIATLISTSFNAVEYSSKYKEAERHEIVVNEFELIDEIIKYLEMI